jgi:hypothetical protein
MPDVTDVSAELRAGKFLLVSTVGGDFGDRVTVVRKQSAAAPIMLIRPDGYVAWAGDDVAAANTAIREWVA